jgi:hypothetical protein
MNKAMGSTSTGWKPMPLPLKILLVVFILWLVGALMNLPNLMENGLPLFGNFVFGASAASIALLLDVVGPVVFLFALWNRKAWSVKWAFAYIGLFILNNTIALFTVREELGLPQILIPTIVGIIFLAVIFWKRGYIQQSDSS